MKGKKFLAFSLTVAMLAGGALTVSAASRHSYRRKLPLHQHSLLHSQPGRTEHLWFSSP